MAPYGRDWSQRHGPHPRSRRHGRERLEYGREFQGEGSRRHAWRRQAYDPYFQESTGYGPEAEYGLELKYGPAEEIGTRRRFTAQRGYAAGRGYGTRHGYGLQGGQRTERGYQPEPEFETERGYRGDEYGYQTYSGARRFSDYGYDYELGEQDWPYRRSYRGAGPYGFRRAQRGAPLPRWGGEEYYGREFSGYRRPPEFGREEGPRYGYTPPDRWPQIGHDVDNLEPEELEMSDSDVREAVLENLFQDSWVNPEMIDVEVDSGVVTLHGEVRDFMEARYAWDDAWESPGVRGVINNLTVRADLPQEGMDLPQTAGGHKGF